MASGIIRSHHSHHLKGLFCSTYLAISKGVDILTSVNLSVDFLSVNTTLIKVPNKLPLDGSRYEPIIFSSTNKIQQEDKIELSFIGYALSKFLNYLPEIGHVVLVDGRTITVKLSENIKKCQPSINLLQGWLTQNSDLPPVFLNKHCPYCEFQNSCKETAIQEDSLSLLGGMTKKQVLKFEKKVFSQSNNFPIFIARAKEVDDHVRNVLPINMSFKPSH